MSRRIPVVALLLATLACTTSSARTEEPARVPHVVATQSATSPRPNIVVIVADDMRYDELAYAPNVRRLIARTGLRFTNSFAPNPLCCPSRASFFTGRYSHNHGVVTHDAPWGFGSFDDWKTLPVFLRRSGYRTGFVGKYLNGYGRMASRVTGGSSLRYVPRGWTDWYAAVEPPPGSGVHGNTYDYFDTPFNINGRIDNSHRGRYQTDVIGRFARKLVGRYHYGRAPFFLYVAPVAPHFGGPDEPHDVDYVQQPSGSWTDVRTPARPAWVRGRFDRVIRRAPGLPADGSPPEANVWDKPTFFRRPTLRDPDRSALLSSARQRAEAIFVLDRQIGELVRKLKRLGEWRDTVLIFTSDNGYFLGEHRHRSGKAFAHEPSLRVPLVVSGPGIPAGEVRHDPITTVDLFPTILDLADVPARRWPTYDGRSMVPVMRGRDLGWTVPVVTEGRVVARALHGRPPRFRHGLTSTGLRTARYSFMVYAGGQRELYDLAVDGHQLVNVVRRPRYAAVVAVLARTLQRYRNCRGDECRRSLPVSLAASSVEERRLARLFRQQIAERTGH